MGKFTIGPVEKVDLDNVLHRNTSEFADTVSALKVGEAVVIKGMSSANVSSRGRIIAIRSGDGRKYVTHKVGNDGVQIVRVK